MKAHESTEMLSSVKCTKVGEEHFENGCDLVKLTEVSYETFLQYQNDVEDLLPDKEGGEEDSYFDSHDDETPADVVFGGMPLRTTSGRTVICPNHLDLLFIFHRLLVNACHTDNEWLIMSFLPGCYSYGKAQSDN